MYHATVNPAYVQSHWAQASKRLERLTRRAQALLCYSVARRPKHTLPLLTCWKKATTTTKAEMQMLTKANSESWHRELHRWLNNEGAVKQWVGSQARQKDHTRRQWCMKSHNLQSALEVEAVTHAVQSLLKWQMTHSNHHSHWLSKTAAKSGVWIGLPWLAHGHTQSSWIFCTSHERVSRQTRTAQQNSQLVYSLVRQSFWAWTVQSILPLTAWRKVVHRK